jgi:tetratricopeptide (TPR) repeat protein
MNIKFDFSKIPVKSVAISVAIFLAVLGGYIGVKKTYEHLATKASQQRIVQEQQYQTRLALIKTEVATGITDAPSAVAKSQEFIKAGDGERAEAAAELATQKDPLWRDAFLNLGQIYMSINKFDKAEDALKVALTKDPICGQGHYLLSLVYQERGNTDASKLELAKAKSLGFQTEIGG